jgi:hypothetical protein
MNAKHESFTRREFLKLFPGSAAGLWAGGMERPFLSFLLAGDRVGGAWVPDAFESALAENVALWRPRMSASIANCASSRYSSTDRP